MGVFNVWPWALKRKAHKKPKQSIKLSGKKGQSELHTLDESDGQGTSIRAAQKKSAIICELSGRWEMGELGTASGCVFMPFRIDYSNKNRRHCCSDSTNNWNGRGNVGVGNGDGDDDDGDVSCRLMVTGQKQWPNENWPFFCCLSSPAPTFTSILCCCKYFATTAQRLKTYLPRLGGSVWGIRWDCQVPAPNSIAEIFNLLSQHVRRSVRLNYDTVSVLGEYAEHSECQSMRTTRVKCNKRWQ